jgi:copper(I)-binding protein
MNRLPHIRRAVVVVMVAASSVGLAACSGAASTATSTSAASTAPAAGDAKLILADGWVRSKEVMPATATSAAMTDMSMTGIFGKLTNTTDQAITISGGSSPAAGMVELHETVPDSSGAMIMQPKAGGFVVPAKGTFELKPGGNHIMLMKLPSMPKIGTAVDVTLQTSAGEITLKAIPVRNFAGGDEKYVPAAATPTTH